MRDNKVAVQLPARREQCLILVAFLADVLAANRKMLEEVKYQIKKADCEKSTNKNKVQ